MFQFPSNGKVYSEKIYLMLVQYWTELKFQFPSNGKVYSELEEAQESLDELLFQFPSNGKVYSETRGIGTLSWEQCFNSLQTGKCIQRPPPPRR